MSRHNRFLGLMIAVTLTACGGTTTPATDAGGNNDAGPGDTGPVSDAGHDAGAATACGSSTAVTLHAGAQMVMGDTTGAPHDVSLGTCGGPTTDTMPTAPERVFAVQLPGAATDHVAVSYTLVNAGTDAMFDTTTQVRTACMSATNAICFDDADPVHREYRSDGFINGLGGSTHYLIVSGYRTPLMGFHNSGPFQIDFTTYVNPTPPTYTSGDAMLVDGRSLTIHVMGMDAQGSALGLAVSFLDASMMAIAVHTNGAMMPAVTDLGPYDFVENLFGMTSFTGTVQTNDPGTWPMAEVAMARFVRVSIINGSGQNSTPDAIIPLTLATTVHVGQTCDMTHVCPMTTSCTTGTCTVTPAVATACAAATTVTTLTPTTPYTTTVDLGTGMGVLEPSCVDNTGIHGDEKIFNVMVPATGTFDLLATTLGSHTGTCTATVMTCVDTVLYDRTICGDPSTETGCNDDDPALMMATPHGVSSALEVRNAAAGMHSIVLDSFGTFRAMVTADLSIRLRPVLATGTACDPTGVMNRCAGAVACPTSGAAMCP